MPWKTVCKWLERYEELGVAGLADASRRPHTSPRQIGEKVEPAIVETRRRTSNSSPYSSSGTRPFGGILPVDVDSKNDALRKMKTRCEALRTPMIAVNPPEAESSEALLYGFAELGDFVPDQKGVR